MSQKKNVTVSKGSTGPASPVVGSPTKPYTTGTARKNMQPTLPKK